MKQKKLFKLATITAFAVGILALTPMTADAAKAPKKTTISPGVSYSYSSNISKEGAIRVEFDEPGDYIKNIKVKNKNLIAKETYSYADYSKYTSEYYSNESKSDFYYTVIGLYAKKNLTTTITFDIYDINNKKKETKTVKVTTKSNTQSSTGSPIKSITYAGKPFYYGQLTSNSKGKLKVKMNKNYKLVSIEIGTYTKPSALDLDALASKSDCSSLLQNKINYKKVKNNSKITLGKYASYYESFSTSSYSDYKSYGMRNYILAPTQIRITYKNTKTKDTGVLQYELNSFAK